jgi:hypothetical protein
VRLTYPVIGACTDSRWLRRRESKLDGADSESFSQPLDRAEARVRVPACLKIADGGLVQPRRLRQIVLSHLPALPRFANREFLHTDWNITVWTNIRQAEKHPAAYLFSRMG